jgi:hypothetical protein
MAKLPPYNLGFMGQVYGCRLVGLWLVLTPSNERADPRQNSQRAAPASGYSYARVTYYCGRITDSLIKSGN